MSLSVNNKTLSSNFSTILPTFPTFFFSCPLFLFSKFLTNISLCFTVGATARAKAGGLAPIPEGGGGGEAARAAGPSSGGVGRPCRGNGVLVFLCSALRAKAGGLAPPPEGGGDGVAAQAARLSAGGVGRPCRGYCVPVSPGRTSATIIIVLVGVWGGISLDSSGDIVDLAISSCRLSWPDISVDCCLGVVISGEWISS